MTVKLRRIDGTEVDIHCQADEQIFLFKKKIELETGMDAVEQNLMFNFKEVKNGRLQDYGITNGSIVHSVLKLKSNVQNNYYLDTMLDPTWNFPFMNVDDHGTYQIRGKLPYYRPCGSMRNALKDGGLFDNGNDDWLKMDGNPREWCVAYNGSNCDKHQAITDWGKKLRARGVDGNIVFATPNFDEALKHSDVLVDPKTGKKYKIIFQHRLKPDQFTRASVVGGPDNYLYVNNQSFLRTYGICVFELK